MLLANMSFGTACCQVARVLTQPHACRGMAQVPSSPSVSLSASSASAWLQCPLSSGACNNTAKSFLLPARMQRSLPSGACANTAEPLVGKLCYRRRRSFAKRHHVPTWPNLSLANRAGADIAPLPSGTMC